MKSVVVATSLAAVLATAPAMAQTGGQKSAGTEEKSFIEHVARDNQAEVDLSRLAQQKAASPQVKALAQRLAADHGKANQQLAQIAQQEGVPVRPGVDKDKAALRARLETLNGPAFDRAFLQAQLQDHQRDIQYFQRETKSLKDPQLKSYAQQTLPVLQQHLQLVQQTKNQVVGSGSSSSPAGTPSR